MFPYAIYTRQSRVRHDITLSSCDVQFQICRDFAEAVLPQGSAWCGTHYDDPGQSAESLDRPGLKALLAEIAEGTLSCLIVYRLDRLSRRLIDTVQVLDTLRCHDVELKIVTAPHLGDSTTSQLMLNLLASFAQFEHDLIRERIREGFRARRERCGRLTGKPPYGYDLAEDDGDLAVNHDEARAVRRFFRMALAGRTPRQLAALANRRGLRTKVHVAKGSNRRSGGNAWTPRQVLDLLRNPVYAGCLRDADSGVRPGRHQALVKRAVFDGVQRQLDARRPVLHAPRRNQPLPFRGKVICARCGRLMSPHVILHRLRPRVRYRHYRCRSHAGGRPPCRDVSVPVEGLHRFVLDTMRDRRQLDADPGLTPESRDALQAVAWILDGLRVPDPYRAIGEVVERITFGRGSIRIEFSESAIRELRNRYSAVPHGGGEELPCDRGHGPGR